LRCRARFLPPFRDLVHGYGGCPPPHVTGCVSRIERFPLRLPIRYRTLGASQWSHGTTENISAQGVLVHGVVVPAVRDPLDFRFEVAVGPHRSEVACRGAVVRTVDGGPDQVFAATIDAFTFVRPAD
jgi:PilZ domain